MMKPKPDADQHPTDEGQVMVEDQSSRLVNIYLIAGWAALTILLILAGLLYRRVAVANLIREVDSQNAAFTSQFDRLFWPEFKSYVADQAPSSSRDELQAHPLTDRFRQVIVEQADGLPVVKVTFYTREGLAVFSTSIDDIGQYSNDVASRKYYGVDSDYDGAKLAHYDRFEALDGTLKDCDLVSGYQAFPAQRYKPDGILEIYRDVTPSLRAIKRYQAAIIGISVFIVTLLLGLSLILSGRNKQ